MKKFSKSKLLGGIMCAFFGIVFIASPAAAQDHLWSQRFGDSDTEDGRSVYVDDSGSVIMTGVFQGTVNLGGGTLISWGYQDIYLAKYDADGNHLWSQRFGDSTPDYAWGVTADASGNLYLTGHFYSSINFGGSTLTSSGLLDIFLAKFDPNGNHLWSKRFGGSGSDSAFTVGVDGSGNVFLTGKFRNTVDFGGGPLTSAGNDDIFLVKFDTNGNHLWSQRFGGTDSDEARGLSSDEAGNVAITGDFRNTANFGGGPLSSLGQEEIFLAKYDGNGSHLWSKRLGGTDYDAGRTVSFDSNGDVMVSGRFRGTVNFGGGALTSAGGDDIFLAKYEGSTGAHLWSRRFGSVWDDFVSEVRTYCGGSSIITGAFWTTLDFGGGPLTSAGDEDIFLAKYDGEGNHLWSQRIGGTGQDRGQSVALDPTGEVLITGFFQNTVDFGGGSLNSAGSIDIFLAKYQDSPIVAEDVSAWILRDSSLIPMTGNILLGCPQGDLDALVIQVDLADGCFSGTVAKERLSMSMPLNGNAVLYATHPSHYRADHDARPSNGYLTTFTRHWIGGCGQDEIVIYLDGIEIGRVNIDVRSPDMVTSGDSARIVDILDFSEFAMHYPSCESGSGNYSPCCDFNADGCVDIIDFAIFSMHYNHRLEWW